MIDQTLKPDDEISVYELFAILWSNKFLIGIITGLSIFLSVYYSSKIQKQYKATAVFELQSTGDNGGLNLDGDFGAIASLAGLGGPSSNGKILIERIMSREFILEASENLLLKEDPFFQTYEPTASDPKWKATIKDLLRWEKPEQFLKLNIQEAIEKSYQKYVSADMTSAGAIEISVSHKNPASAALYANKLMEQVRKTVTQEDEDSKNFRLSYLAETLADALQEMEVAQENIKKYNLENSAAAQENFILGSLQLDNLRVERSEVSNYLVVLKTLRDLVQTAKLDSKAYELLRLNSPLVDDISFRRVLGMSETISAWNWPTLETIQNVSETLGDRLNRLDVEIANLEKSAEDYAASAEDQTKLTRDAKIAEATFKLLTEQVKSQTLVAGFRPDTFTVFAYARPPLAPSTPNLKLILALGTVLGFLSGAAISLANSVRRGVFYTRSSIISRSKPKNALLLRSFKQFTKLSGSKLLSELEKGKSIELEEAHVLISNKNLVYITNVGKFLSAFHLSRLLATQSCLSGRKVLIIDFDKNSNRAKDKSNKNTIDGIEIATLDEGFDQVNAQGGLPSFTSKMFERKIKFFLESYDQVFICSDLHKSITALIALQPLNPDLLVLSSLRKTKKNIIDKINDVSPISILFHD